MKPQKYILKGLKALGAFTYTPYSKLRSAAKARADITFIGKKKVEEVQSQMFVYNADYFREKEQIQDFNEFDEARNDPNNIVWLNFHGLHDTSIFENLGTCISIDRFIIRQIVDTTQRAKAEEFDDYLFLNIKSILAKDAGIKIEQLSFLLSKNYLVSFQEERGDHFGHIRSKIRENVGVIRKRGSDFLLAQLLDAILDNYFETIDAINSDIESMSHDIMANPQQALLVVLEEKKKMAESIKRALKPFLEAVVAILNGRTTFLQKGEKKYYRDLKNNCVSAIDEADSCLKTLEGLTNIYFSSLSQKMNETMKVLTTVATIFIPLTFIAGIYGMNFDHMPELHYHNGYFITLGVMGATVLLMLIYFKRKRWL